VNLLKPTTHHTTSLHVPAAKINKLNQLLTNRTDQHLYLSLQWAKLTTNTEDRQKAA